MGKEKLLLLNLGRQISKERESTNSSVSERSTP